MNINISLKRITLSLAGFAERQQVPRLANAGRLLRHWLNGAGDEA